MSSDRPLKALVPGGSSPILPADLIYKTANGEDRLMTYESLVTAVCNRIDARFWRFHCV
jgi:hypothetical protein